MRDIIFRGKRVDNGEWVEGNLFVPDRADTPTQICIGTNIIRISYDVVPETVGQYTGLTDKNGTKIFEGDIINRAYDFWGDEKRLKDISVIEYGEWNCSCCDGVFGWVANGDVDLRAVECSVVIGNIYDNPELLKGGADNA